MNAREKRKERAIQAYWNDLKGMDIADIKTEIRRVQDQIDELEPWLEALVARLDFLAPPMGKDFTL